MRRLALLLLLVVSLVLGTAVAVRADTAYVVQPGDTLFSIARRFNTTAAAVAEANNLVNPNLIYAGQRLLIPGPSGAVPPGGTPPGGAPPPSPPPVAGSSVVVQPGDTLLRIALRHGVTLAALAAVNGIGNPNLIFVGQVLLIPGGSAAPPPAAPPAPPAAPPSAPPAPGGGANLLPNPSFEAGWHNQDGIPELQLPNRWFLTYDEGPNPFDPAPWSVFVRPETRVLPAAYLPPGEQALFIWDGAYTVKIFKGSGALSVRLLTDVSLLPGTYRMTINLFPDLVSGYTGDGQKIWASDPRAGEVRIVVGAGGSDWLLPAFGQRNTVEHTFTVSGQQPVRLGVALRGRYALPNNGWFLDDWSLVRLP